MSSNLTTRTIYGPYQRKDKRWIIIVNGKTISYPKYLYEQHFKIKLHPQETIDHKDGSPENNAIDNLQVLTRKENAAKERKTIKGMCVWCSKEFTLSYAQRNRRAKTKHGPYCSFSCRGHAGK